MESQKKHPKHFSFEFFPPRTPEAVGKLQTTQERLSKLNPSFFSVTYGAGGSTREKTFETVLDIREKTGIMGVPHLSCIGTPAEEILDVLNEFKDNGIDRVVALRGDLPSGSVGMGPLRYANELVEFIRRETGDHFTIEVACYPEFHPQSDSTKQDLLNFKRKVDAGANGAITQYFYNVDAYYSFIDSCEKLGIDIPIVPGIMPITTCTQLVRFSEACGADIPRWILKRLREFGDDRVSIRKFGVEVATKLCDDLLQNGAPGIHIYSMNQAEAAEEIWHNLSLSDR